MNISKNLYINDESNLISSKPFLPTQQLEHGLRIKNFDIRDNINVLSTIQNCEEVLYNSIEILRLSSPNIFSQIEKVTNEILIHMSDSSNSFVSEKTMGTIFLYPKELPTICYFIEELAHQGGHLILLAASRSPSDYFKYEQEAYNQNHHSNTENRTNYVVFHSIFTLAMIATCFKDTLKFNLLEKEQNFEALGRLIYASKRFELDTINLLKLNILNDEGLILLKKLTDSVNSAVSEIKDVVINLDMRGHEYDFSTKTFFSKNCKLII